MLNFIKKLVVLTIITLTMIGCSSKVKVSTTMNMPSKSGLAVKHLSINEFSGRKYGVSGSDVSNKIKSNISKEGYIDINVRSPILLVGEVLPSRLVKNKWSEKHEGKKETWYSYHVSIKQSLSVNFTVYYNGKVLTAGSESFVYEKEKRSNDGYAKAESKLRTNAKVASWLVNKAAIYVSNQLSPYKTAVTLYFLKGSDSNLELGIDYVKRDRLTQAFSIFDQISNKSPSAEDQAKATHNKGLVKLIDGDYAAAFNLMKKANSTAPHNFDILDSMGQVEKYKELNDVHKSQTGK